jgi:hypothetical protein
MSERLASLWPTLYLLQGDMAAGSTANEVRSRSGSAGRRTTLSLALLIPKYENDINAMTKIKNDRGKELRRWM